MNPAFKRQLSDYEFSLYGRRTMRFCPFCGDFDCQCLQVAVGARAGTRKGAGERRHGKCALIFLLPLQGGAIASALPSRCCGASSGYSNYTLTHCQPPSPHPLLSIHLLSGPNHQAIVLLPRGISIAERDALLGQMAAAAANANASPSASSSLPPFLTATAAAPPTRPAAATTIHFQQQQQQQRGQDQQQQPPSARTSPHLPPPQLLVPPRVPPSTTAPRPMPAPLPPPPPPVPSSYATRQSPTTASSHTPPISAPPLSPSASAPSATTIPSTARPGRLVSSMSPSPQLPTPSPSPLAASTPPPPPPPPSLISCTSFPPCTPSSSTLPSRTPSPLLLLPSSSPAPAMPPPPASALFTTSSLSGHKALASAPHEVASAPPSLPAAVATSGASHMPVKLDGPPLRHGNIPSGDALTMPTANSSSGNTGGSAERAPRVSHNAHPHRTTAAAAAVLAVSSFATGLPAARQALLFARSPRGVATAGPSATSSMPTRDLLDGIVTGTSGPLAFPATASAVPTTDVSSSASVDGRSTHGHRRMHEQIAAPAALSPPPRDAGAEDGGGARIDRVRPIERQSSLPDDTLQHTAGPPPSAQVTAQPLQATTTFPSSGFGAFLAQASSVPPRHGRLGHTISPPRVDIGESQQGAASKGPATTTAGEHVPGAGSGAPAVGSFGNAGGDHGEGSRARAEADLESLFEMGLRTGPPVATPTSDHATTTLSAASVSTAALVTAAPKSGAGGVSAVPRTPPLSAPGAAAGERADVPAAVISTVAVPKPHSAPATLSPSVGGTVGTLDGGATAAHAVSPPRVARLFGPLGGVLNPARPGAATSTSASAAYTTTPSPAPSAGARAVSPLSSPLSPPPPRAAAPPSPLSLAPAPVPVMRLTMPPKQWPEGNRMVFCARYFSTLWERGPRNKQHSASVEAMERKAHRSCSRIRMN